MVIQIISLICLMFYLLLMVYCITWCMVKLAEKIEDALEKRIETPKKACNVPKAKSS